MTIDNSTAVLEYVLARLDQLPKTPEYFHAAIELRSVVALIEGIQKQNDLLSGMMDEIFRPVPMKPKLDSHATIHQTH